MQRGFQETSDELDPPEDELTARLEIDLPDRLAVGPGNAFLIAGYAYRAGGARMRSLEVELDGERTPALHLRLGRRDVHERALNEAALLGEGTGGLGEAAFRSGFVAVVRVRPRERSGRAEARLVAGFADGSELTRSLGSLRLDPEVEAPEPQGLRFPAPDGPRVAICMATHKPPPELFREQIASLRAQTHRNWVCVISDDHSHPDEFEGLLAEIGSDPRFAVSRNPSRLGFYHNFERALAMAPKDADFLALCDQDDRWHPDKLERLLERMEGGIELCYSDARVVDEAGCLVHPSYWTTRRTNYTNLGSLLIGNTVTGAASLFRASIREDLLPFPPRLADPFHDHWLALVALARGRIAYVEDPLYDYVQHQRAVLGHAAANEGHRAGRRSWRERIRKPGPRGRVVYYYPWSQQQLFAEVLRLRCWDRMTGRKRRTLRRFLTADRRLGSLAWLLGRRVRRLAGRNETLDLERSYSVALIWRRGLSLVTAGRRRPLRWLHHDARVPPAPVLERQQVADEDVWSVMALTATIKPLDLVPDPAEPERIEVLVPGVELKHLTRSDRTALELAMALARRGHRVRAVVIEGVSFPPRDWGRHLEARPELGDLFDLVELAFARDRDVPLRLNPRDRLLATTWPGAHIASAALERLDADRFVYLIDGLDGLTLAEKPWAQAASESLSLPHSALFTSEVLRAHFRRRGLGVYSAGAERGDSASASLREPIAPISAPPAAELARRSRRAVLVDARPRGHVVPDVLALAVSALAEAVAGGEIGPEWLLHGVGEGGDGPANIELAPARTLQIVPAPDRAPLATVAARGGHDVGLSLDYGPGPGLRALEMAAAGMVVVVTRFGEREGADLKAISENLLPADLDPAAVRSALAEAVRRAPDGEARVRAAAFEWPRSWDQALGERVLSSIEELL